MITYKIRDKETNEKVYNIYVDMDGRLMTDTFDGPEVVDQSRYTIEREISDDVLEKICEDYHDETYGSSFSDKILKKIIRKHLFGK